MGNGQIPTIHWEISWWMMATVAETCWNSWGQWHASSVVSSIAGSAGFLVSTVSASFGECFHLISHTYPRPINPGTPERDSCWTAGDAFAGATYEQKLQTPWNPCCSLVACIVVLIDSTALLGSLLAQDPAAKSKSATSFPVVWAEEAWRNVS